MRFPLLFTLCDSKRLCNPVVDDQSAEGRRGALVIPARVAGQVGGVGLGHAFASASRFRKAVSPASDTLTHFGWGEASASALSCQFYHLYGGVWGGSSGGR